MGGDRTEAGRHLLRRGGRSILPVGAHFVPTSGPDWPWREGPGTFARAFAAMAALGCDSVRIDVLWEAVEPDEGRYDERHLAVLDEILALARRHGLTLHPALFIGGEVGDAVWDVRWRGDRHPHADPGLVAGQAAHAGMLARRWAGDPSILAWDLTDEPPYWLSRTTSDADARAWTDALARAIRSADPGALVTIGTAGQEIAFGPFRADVVAGSLDFATVHPYPIYSPALYPDALLSPRMTLAGAFETALAAGVGRPVMVHEYGATSAQWDPERIGAYDRLLCWSSLGRGATGFFAWCWTDAEPAATRRAPYVRQPHETQFGVTDWRGEVRPRGRVLGELAATVRALDLDAVAAGGPVTVAALPIPHEYAQPWDPAAYGLAGASGTYRPAEAAWAPGREVSSLISAALNAFVLAARAGTSVGFPRERLDGAWPETKLLLLPAPLTSSANTLIHVRTALWDGAAAHAARGGSAWISCSAESAIPEMDALAGCRIIDRAPVRGPAVLRFVRPWGPFAEGDTLTLPPAAELDLATRGVTLGVSDAEVIAVDEVGAPALVVARRGSGWVVTCSRPVELLLGRLPDAHGPDDRSWGLYAGLVELAGARDEAGVDHPDVVSGQLRGERGGLLAITNHAPTPVRASVRVPPGAHGLALVDGRGSRPLGEPAIDLEPHGAAIVTWSDAARPGA